MAARVLLGKNNLSTSAIQRGYPTVTYDYRADDDRLRLYDGARNLPSGGSLVPKLNDVTIRSLSFQPFLQHTSQELATSCAGRKNEPSLGGTLLAGEPISAAVGMGATAAPRASRAPSTTPPRWRAKVGPSNEVRCVMGPFATHLSIGHGGAVSRRVQRPLTSTQRPP